MRGTKFIGNKKLEKRLKKFAKKQKVSGYDVGFFKEAKYRNGTPVAEVAAMQEFGTATIPERPFFRKANVAIKPALRKKILSFLKKGDDYILTETDMAKLGMAHEAEIKEIITALRSPPNAASTINKKQSDNPLIDTGLMRNSVTSKVVL